MLLMSNHLFYWNLMYFIVVLSLSACHFYRYWSVTNYSVKYTESVYCITDKLT